MTTSHPPSPSRASRRGLAYGIAAYGLWGFMPVYIKSVRAAPVLEVLCHRVVWALAFLLLLSWRQGQLGALRSALRSRRALAILAASTTFLAVNWLVYIWAVVNGRLLEGSLGYYINPLVNVLFGVVILGERLERPVRIAVGIAAAGVLWLALNLGEFPWIPLVLATSFGLYGLMRKLAPVGALAGLAVETALLLPLTGGYLAWARGRSLVFISYGKDVAPAEHPYYRHVYLRRMPIAGGKPTVIAYVYGGQGTINVPSWSPDGRMIAFVSNSEVP